MSSSNADLAEDFVRRFDTMKARGIEISGVIADVLRTILGETPAFAVMHIIGKEAFCNPSTFAGEITEAFGYASKIVFEELLAESEKYSPYVTARTYARPFPEEKVSRKIYKTGARLLT